MAAHYPFIFSIHSSSSSRYHSIPPARDRFLLQQAAMLACSMPVLRLASHVFSKYPYHSPSFMPINLRLYFSQRDARPFCRPSSVRFFNIFFRLFLGTLYSPHFLPLFLGTYPGSNRPFTGLRVSGVGGRYSSMLL